MMKSPKLFKLPLRLNNNIWLHWKILTILWFCWCNLICVESGSGFLPDSEPCLWHRLSYSESVSMSQSVFGFSWFWAWPLAQVILFCVSICVRVWFRLFAWLWVWLRAWPLWKGNLVLSLYLCKSLTPTVSLVLALCARQSGSETDPVINCVSGSGFSSPAWLV